MRAMYFSLFAAGAMFGLPGCCNSHHAHARSFEYKTLTTLNDSGESQLNSLGKDGWVVVGFTFLSRAETHSNDEYRYVLIRPAKTASKPAGPAAATTSPTNVVAPPLSYQWYLNPNDATNR